MKILMVFGISFTPPSPRTYRVRALAEELRARGHEVWLLNSEEKRLYMPEEFDRALRIGAFASGYSDRLEAGSGRPISRYKYNRLYRRLVSVYDYLFFFRRDTFAKIAFTRKLLKGLQGFDVLISVSSPFYVHLATMWPRRPVASVKILDCSDPFTSSGRSLAPHWRLIEKLTYRHGDFVCVPTDKAVPLYERFVPREKLRVIPQGINLSEFGTDEYVPNDKPTFVYAGVFYDKIRNPIFFLEYLCSVREDFEFNIYIRTDSPFFGSLKTYEERLGGRLRVHPFVERAECIRIMSRADFLINFENTSQFQNPSKLIDYAVAGRPVLSFSSENFCAGYFEEFLRGDYSHGLVTDVSSFDNKRVTSQFEALFIGGAK